MLQPVRDTGTDRAVGDIVTMRAEGVEIPSPFVGHAARILEKPLVQELDVGGVRPLQICRFELALELGAHGSG